MELPAEVTIHNELFGAKGREGRLLGIRPEGYYEITTAFGNNEHRVMLPISSTVLIAAAAEDEISAAQFER